MPAKLSSFSGVLMHHWTYNSQFTSSSMFQRFPLNQTNVPLISHIIAFSVIPIYPYLSLCLSFPICKTQVGTMSNASLGLVGRIRWWDGVSGNYLNDLDKEMATQSNILAWEISWTEEPGELQSLESQRVGHGWMTEHGMVRGLMRASLSFLSTLV